MCLSIYLDLLNFLIAMFIFSGESIIMFAELASLNCLMVFYFIYFFVCSFIHMCIYCLGHFSPFPPYPTLPPPLPQFQAGLVLPLCLMVFQMVLMHW
jgi:hypothetical protein